METKIRIGIDVGGTHTKAVAIDNNTHEILGKASVKTTHDAKVGVAEGVFQAFEKCLEDVSNPGPMLEVVAGAATLIHSFFI